jgi:hypothetical protein
MDKIGKFLADTPKTQALGSTSEAGKMMLRPTSQSKLPSPTPNVDLSMSPQELVSHRTMISFSVRTVLSAYFQPSESEEIKAAQLSWWCDELQSWSAEQVMWALRKWNRDNSRLRPTPGDIVALLKQERGKSIARKMAEERTEQAEQPKERLDAERANSILREYGFSNSSTAD